MNKKEVLQVIRNPKSLSEAKLKEIEKIAADFPYFQGAHTLIAIGHEKFHNPATKRSLSKAALYTTDRKFLKQLLDNLKSDGSRTPRTTAVQPKPVAVAPAEVPDSSPAEAPAAALPEPEISVAAAAVDPADSASEGVATEVSSIATAVDENKDATLAPAVQLGAVPGAEEEENDAKEEDGTEVLYLSHDELLKEVFENLEVLKKTKSQYLEVERKIEDAEFEEAKIKAVTKANNNYLSKKDKNGSSSKSNKSAKKPSLQQADSQNGEKKKAVDGLVKADQNQIIEEFIKNNPRIKTQSLEAPKGKKTGKTVDLAAPSVQLKDEVATENMALIYIKQGRNDKAIEVYEKLIWKYPQKKAYFAAQIENLQK